MNFSYTLHLGVIDGKLVGHSLSKKIKYRKPKEAAGFNTVFNLSIMIGATK